MLGGAFRQLRIAAALLLSASACHAQVPAEVRYLTPTAYSEQDSSAVWRSLGASYVRKALKEDTLNRDPAWNARLDTVMAAIGAAAARLYPTLAGTRWSAFLIEDFGHGAVAFPGGTVLVDSRFARQFALTDNELALILAHEVAHVVAGHPSEKLSFMAVKLGLERMPTAGSALLAFFTQDAYARLFRPTAKLQEREADAIGALILGASGYDALQALAVFDKLAIIERAGNDTSSHDPAPARKESVRRVLETSAFAGPHAAE